DPNELTYDDLGLNGGNYEYWVTAIYDYGESDLSNVEEVTIVLNPPQNLQAVVQGMNNVFLSWDEPATRDLDFYNVYRDSILIGSNTSTFYLDVGVPAGPHIYNVTAIYDGGWESEFSNNSWYPPADVGDTPIPVVTELIGNHPNPFNPTTTISFSLQNNSNVEISIYNIKGQKVKTLVNHKLTAGEHSVVWDGRDDNNQPVGSGVYFYKFKTDNFEKTRKMILLR
ncbi:MAG: T9SS type A sorting domain-containing protein, partial [Armatimonadetes bacterium]|nr:T9SS type A sorting domain-containing protein [Armatimonadota bacterium]